MSNLPRKVIIMNCNDNIGSAYHCKISSGVVLVPKCRCFPKTDSAFFSVSELMRNSVMMRNINIKNADQIKLCLLGLLCNVKILHFCPFPRCFWSL